MMVFVHPAQCKEPDVSLQQWECVWLERVTQTPQVRLIYFLKSVIESCPRVRDCGPVDIFDVCVCVCVCVLLINECLLRGRSARWQKVQRTSYQKVAC